MITDNRMRRYKEFESVLEIYDTLECMEIYIFMLLRNLKIKKLVLDHYTKKEMEDYYSNLIYMFEIFSDIENESCKHLTFASATFNLDHYTKRGNFDDYEVNEEKYKNNDKFFSIIENSNKNKELVKCIDFLDKTYYEMVNEYSCIEELKGLYYSPDSECTRRLNLKELNDSFRNQIDLINKRITDMALNQNEIILNPSKALRKNKLHLHHNFLSFLLNSFYLPHLYFSLTLYSAKVNHTISKYLSYRDLEYLFEMRDIANNYIVKITKKYLFKEFNKCYKNFCIKRLKLDELDLLNYLSDECKKGNEVINKYYGLSLLSFEDFIKDISVEYNKYKYTKIQKYNQIITRFANDVNICEKKYIKEVVEPFFNK